MEQLTQQKKRVDFDLSAFGGDDREEMARMYEETMKDFVAGSIVQGKVLEIRNNEVLVDIGYKSEGLIPASEFGDLSEIKEGDAYDVLLAEIEDDDGMVVLSKERADQQLRWERVLETCAEGSTVTGTVKTRVRGGLIVDVDGVDAFLPGSQIDVIPVRNTDAFIGRDFEFKVLKISPERRNIIVSRRELIEETLRVKKRKLMAEIEVGQRRNGRAKNITDFGVFVD
ncbi:MAG: S1 RNA-binding domain-containing protein, partial [Kiritimatiellia bacterium]|nr:S1 RNA-binding domain-containing protein [Kiritimatiellia bacterium]